MESDFLVIGFSRAKGFKPVSKAIMFVEDTNFSHTYLKVTNRHFGDIDIYQASKGMVNHLLEDTFLEKNEVIAEFKIPVSALVKKDTVLFIRKRLGKPYSYLTIAILAILAYFPHLKFLDRFLDGEKAYICSELIARAIKHNNIIDLDINLDRAKPSQLFEIISNKYS